MRRIIEGAVVFPDRIDTCQLTIEDGLIKAIARPPYMHGVPTDKIPDGQFISPGFIDLQINGAFGKEFKTDTDAVSAVTRGIVQFGTTAICPTVTTLPLSSYKTHLHALLTDHIAGEGARVLGVHLEGPFLNPKKVGAQNASLLVTPRDCEYDEYINERVAIVTLSPELDGSLELIARLLADGKRVGIGHSLIEYDEVKKLFDPDRMMIVHIFNAMADLSSRSPGLAGAGLESDGYTVTLIADGIHVHPANIRILWNAKRDRRKLICITDGSAVSGLEEGVHQIGSRTIEKMIDRAVLAGTNTLVGSILTQNVAVRNLMVFTGCSLPEAINTVTINPATFLSVQDRLGAIRVGAAADIAIFDRDVNVQMTFVNGELVWQRRG